MTKEKLKLIIDTDPGHDDAMAILMMLASDEIDILAITTVAGNSSIKNTTRNAQYILDLAKRSDIPVYSGASKPLVKKLIQANVHGASGLDGSNNNIGNIKLSNNAPEKIIKLVLANPEKVTILALGPLTNIARAIEMKPKIAKLIEQIIIMGGAINVPGNKNRVAEFNFFVDPNAASIVMESKIPKILVPLDACNDILMTDTDIQQFSQGKIGQTLAQMLKPYIANLAKFDGIKGAAMYDPLAAYYLINPANLKLEPMDIKIETCGKFTSGMCVCENRISEKKNFNIKVATKINGEKFIKDFIGSIKKLDQPKTKTLIFDMDGTLYKFDGKTVYETNFYKKIKANAIKYISKNLDKREEEAQNIYDFINNKYKYSISVGLEKEYGFNRYSYFNTVWDIEPKNFLKNDTDIQKILNILSQKYNLILLSDAPMIWIKNVLKFFQIEELFTDKIYSGEGDIRKEFGNAFKEIIKKHDLIAEDCVSIGDQEHTDIIPAKNLGMKTVHISEKKSEIADYTINNILKIKTILKGKNV